MTRENKPEGVTEKRNDYAFLVIPGSARKVTYSLPVFHEIDFTVNEGYRKIPHGGIEEGGLLFGTIDEEGTHIETYRLIACEHASGPSFLLSDRDLDVLRVQIENADADPELEGLHVVGWFLAHTRSPLTLTDREFELCDRLFGHSGMITVLVKPERFQPTRFGFLVRSEDGSLSRDGAQNAIILPLPGRNVKAPGGAVSSIPAPTANPTATRRSAEADAISAARNEREIAAESVSPPPVAQPAEPLNHANRRPRRLQIEQVLAKQEEEQISVSPAGPANETESKAVVPATGASRRGSMILRPLPNEERELDVPDAYQQADLLNRKGTPSSTARMVMVLPLAALLGCLVGWLAFLQVPPPIIPLSVKARGENVVVTWPSEQTRNAIYAAVRVDDSTPVPLTPEEKSTGRVEVQARPDMKVELIARNWIRDSRGIVHYVKPVANTAP